MSGFFDDLVPAKQSAGGMFDEQVSDQPGDKILRAGGFMASAKQSAGSLIKGAGQFASDFIPGVTQDNPVKQYGQDVIDANPTAVHSLSDIADRPVMAAKEAVGNAGASMAGIIGARLLGQGITAAAPLAGPAAPIVAGVGQGVSLLGPYAVAALPSFGSIREQQGADDSIGAKAAAAAGAATVGVIENKFGPQEWALSALTKGGREQLAEKFAAKTLAGSVAKGIGTGAAVEGGEELVQNPVEQLAAFQDPTTRENVQDTLFSGAMGAIGGGIVGGPMAGLAHRQPRPAVVPRSDGQGAAVIDPSAGPLSAAAAEHLHRADARAAEAATGDLFGDLADPLVGAPETASDPFADEPISPLLTWQQDTDPVTLQEAQTIVQQARDAGYDGHYIIRHGEGFTAVPKEWLNADQLQGAAPLQPGAVDPLAQRVQTILDAYDAAGHPDNGKIIRAALKSRAPTEQGVTFWEKQLERNLRTWQTIDGQSQPVQPKLRTAADLWEGDHEQASGKFVPENVTAAVLARSNALVQQLAERGVHVDEVDSRFPADVTGIKAQESGLRGLFLRYTKQLEAKAKGYKRFDPAALAKTEAELFKEIGLEQPSTAPAGWDGLTSGEQVTTKAGTTGTLHFDDSNTIAYVTPDKLADGNANPDAGQTSARATGTFSVTPAEVSKATIEDFGEKVGGARKDLAQPTGPKPKAAAAPAEVEPGWRKRFTTLQNMLRTDPTWNLIDTKTGKPIRGAEFKTEQAAKDAIPMIAVAQKHRVVSVKDGFEIMRDVSDRKRVKVVEQIFPTRDDAMAYMATHAQEIIETKTSFREELFARPEKVMRDGALRRPGPATAEDFAKTFGFRGVEFGNWNNQDERQEVMNHAFDGLLDLADVLGVPPQALSLNGDLALAFGARGQGLSGAVAHYERNYGVINLTKLQGAGALAHEWMHAADHYFGRQDGKASSEKVQNKRGDMVFETDGPSDYASHGLSYTKSGMREELRAKYKALIQTLFTKAEQYVEDTAQAEKFVGNTRDALVKSLTAMRLAMEKPSPFGKRNNKPATAEQLAEFDRLAADIIDGKAFVLEARFSDKRTSRYSLASARLSNDTLDALSNLYKAVRGRSGMNAEKTGIVDGIRGDMRRYADRVKMLDDARNGNEKSKSVPTRFAMDAKRIDQGSATDYWTTPHEMAARAFSAYVEDKLPGRSDFLSYGSNNAMPEYRLFNVRPFPEGVERMAINQAFDEFVGALKIRETEKGIEFYSQSTSPAELDQHIYDLASFGLSASDLLTSIAQGSATPFNRELAKLLKAKGFNAKVQTAPGDGKHAGMYDLASNTITLYREEGAEATFLHEIVHAATLKAIAVNSVATGRMRRLLKQVRTELGEGGHYGLSTTAEFVAEALSNPEFQQALKAVKVARSVLGSLWAEFVSTVRQLLGLDAKHETALGHAIELGAQLMQESLEIQSAPANVGPQFRVIAAPDKLTVRDWLGHQLSNQRSWALGALTRDQLADIYGREMPEVADFDRVVQQMDQARNIVAEQADAIIERWRKLPAKTADTLASIMHSATLEQFDPDTKTRDDVATPEQSILLKDWAALPEEAKQLYRDVRDQYAATLAKLRNGLSKRAERAGAAGQRIAAEIRLQFDKYLAEGPYFPLARFGDFVLIADKHEQRIVEAFESSAARERRARQLRVTGWKTKLTAKKSYSATKDGPAGEFVGDVLKLVDGLEIEAKEKASLMDSLNQLAISALPDQSYRRHFTHRKGTAGFSQDAMRAFASSMQHVAHHVARVLHGDELTLLLESMNKRIAETTGDADTTTQQQVANELAKRLDLMMNPNTHPVTALAGQVGFVMSLGGSVASGLTNLSQTPLITFPWLGAKFGFDKAASSLTKASKDYFGGKWDKWSGFVLKDNQALSADERRALQQLEDAGLINLTQTSDLASTATTDSASSQRSWAINRAMKIIGWTFSVPEVFNRQVSALAAYRLSVEEGQTHDQAVETALETLRRTHFDYSASNRSRWMAGNFTRVVTMFKQYSQQMTYLLWRNAYQALKGESPEVRREARRMLLGVAAMHFSAAGALGLPLGVFGITPLLGLLAMGMGSGDDPWDWQVEFRKMLADTFGKAGGEAIAHGPLRMLTNVDFASRVGLGDLWVRTPQGDKEGRDLVEAWMLTLLGPVAGYVGNLGTAARAFDEGKVGRGLEAMLPKMLAAPLRAARYETEGVKSWRGDDLGVALTGADILGTALGFNPSKVAEMHEGQRAIKNREGALVARREEIINQWMASVMAGDQEMTVEAMKEGAAFSARNPGLAIRQDSLQRSLQTKLRNQAMIKDGVYLQKRRQGLRAEGRFANVE